VPRLLAEIAYHRAAQALTQQEAALNELRSRTGTLLSAEALTTSFLGAVAIQRGELGLPGRMAIVCFAVSVGAALVVLLPWRGLRFALNGPSLYERLHSYGEDEEEIHRRAAYWLEEFWTENLALVDRLNRSFSVSVAALALELVLWAVDVRGIL
jgi:hypothetical protein